MVNPMIKATYITHSGDDNLVVNAARVSFRKQADKYTDEGNHGLIRYLAKHNHKSPFNHTWATFHVSAPIFVARQLQKHEYMPWNEVSRRYVDDEPELFVPDVWRGRSADKKQGSDGVVELGFFNTEGARFEGYFGEGNLAEAVAESAQDQIGLYESLILVGVAPEQARMVLPQSMMTEWYWSGTAFAFAKMCNLRLSPDSQYESRIVADQISEKMGELFPVSWDALMEGEK
jgi:thymidylate synthase (FAD)